MAGLFSRFFATLVDDFLPLIVFIIAIGITPLFAVIVLSYIVLFLILFARGTTPGKSLLGLRVIKTDGSYTGFWTMFLREFIGKFISGFFFCLGYFWAIWDKDRQAWHDKIAGTVVVSGFKQAEQPSIERRRKAPQAINPNLKEPLRISEKKTLEVSSSKSGIRCGNCGAELTKESKFCMDCGQSVKTPGEKVICKSCKTELPGDSRFCWECGAPV
jgi:uncharacterized RDD family membrane protein YckC